MLMCIPWNGSIRPYIPVVMEESTKVQIMEQTGLTSPVELVSGRFIELVVRSQIARLLLLVPRIMGRRTDKLLENGLNGLEEMAWTI